MLIQEYQASWAADFSALKAVLSIATSGLKTTIHHVGSTAVPDLPAKPIIDIDLAFEPATIKFVAIKESLEKIGYYHNGNQGIPEREVFKRKETEENRPVLDEIAHHLYVCPADSEELRRHLVFRDQLRTNEDYRQQYGALKYAIAEAAKQNRKKYAKLKETEARGFIEGVLIGMGI